jgi:hypothetical protein
MIKLFNFILKSIIGILLLLAIGIVSIIVFVNPGNYKPQISSFVEKQTGYQLHIEGDIKWSLLPFSLYIQDIVVMNKTSLEKLLESKEARVIIKPIDYIMAVFTNKKKQAFLLKLNATVFYGLKTKLNVESNINVGLGSLQVDGNVKLLPIEYQNDTKAVPLTIAFTLDKGGVSIIVDEKNVDVQVISKIFVSESLLFGVGAIKVNLSSARNNNEKGLLNNLAGTMDVSIKDGKIKGIDIFSTLAQAENNLNALFDTMRGNVKQGIDVLLSNDSKAINNVLGENYFSGFSSLKLQAFFKGGVASQSTLSLQHPSYTVQGVGLIDLPKNNLDYQFYAVLNKFTNNEPQQVAQYVHTVPLLIKINGPINQPVFSINKEEYLRAALQELQKSLFSGAIGALLKKP